jgi:hypothetical protein
MTAVTASGTHTMHGSISYTQEQAINLGQSFELPLAGGSPRSPFFPSQSSSSPRPNQQGPIPNPPFVFPARPTPTSAPSSLSRATGRRPVSAIDIQGEAKAATPIRSGNRRSPPPALPSFSFNPSATQSDQPQSPLLSPSRSLPIRPGGHRRGGSEFIGGDGATGVGLGLMSTSPTHGDGVLPSPNAPASLGPPAGRRGHAHRRSAAISCHDLTMILKPAVPNASLRAGSAPSSPSEIDKQHPSFLGSVNPTFKMPVSGSSETNSVVDPSPMRVLNKARVDFSDTLEYIPRPHSVVSSDTSSIATVRPGHSISGSLSSIVSSGTSSPPARDPRRIPSPISSTASTPVRPKSAGAVLSKMIDEAAKSPDSPQSQAKSRPSPLLNETGSASPTAPKLTPKKYLFFGQEPGERSPTTSSPVTPSTEDTKDLAIEPSPCSSPLMDRESPAVLTKVPSTASRRSSISRKPSKKQKKVRSWAGSILSRKSRPHSQKQKALSRRSPTPPLRSFTPISADHGDHAGQVDSPNVEGSPAASIRPSVQTDFASWKPRQVSIQDDDAMSPIIDLDAALGPFNTPSHDPAWEASQGRRLGASKRRMHSAAGMSGFVGPGMHYHRRAESAPEMVAFDFPRSGLHRLGSSSTMADVFEEDEEDDWEDTKSLPPTTDGDSDHAVSGTSIQVVDAENMTIGKTMDWTVDSIHTSRSSLNHKGSGLSQDSDKQVGSSMKSERSNTSLRDEPIAEEPASTVGIADENMPPSPGSGARASDSTLTPPLRPHEAKELAPVQLGPIFLQPSYGSPTSPMSDDRSPLPSPRSPMSYDTQRISTAPSSVTDEHSFQSLLGGEPGPEVRMSVDDVPSLTSSESTMTSALTFTPNGPQFRDGQRSASLSAAANRKRSSMASLSRLISSSHGEKSKLSIESSAPGSPASFDRKDKSGKSRRFSRMMQFWKPKDTKSAAP